MRFDTSNGMGSNAVNSLYIDSKGSLWAATRAGIAHISDTSNPKLEIYNHNQGLIDENVRSIIEDEKGNIWLSTNGGIAQWKSDEKKISKLYLAPRSTQRGLYGWLSMQG